MSTGKHRLGCPRCGYDLSGHTHNWTDSCPLQARCPECGLNFPWVRAFRPELGDWDRLIEHAPPRMGAIARASLETWVCAAMPPRFWKRLRLDHRISFRRLVLWPFLLLLPFHAAASLLSMLIYWWVRSATVPGRAPGSSPAWYEYVASFTYPLAILSPDPTRAAAMGNRPLLQLPGGWWFAPLTYEWPWWVVFALGMHASYGVLTLLLPTTRRFAKVRAGHVARALIYGLWWVVVLAAFRLLRNTLICAGILFGFTPPSVVRITYLQELAPDPFGLLLIALVAWWWALAMLRGWKLPAAPAIWALLTFAAALAGAVTVVIFVPYWRLGFYF